ncbi:hypothetical protein Molly5_32 [Maribacter phage Molly_5]|uniref:Uncharacterized protein n=2 Tax=Mollyvirus TaxID=2948826 RepID=A0A8E4UY01_9CAUD|nr:hypothetical protein M1M29_gp032 [Maribacter phage Molly_1]YP_010357280.1 hypothetical protein M1M30_gp031 [Maribacter phage Colly_1]QQO97714.1 hypothetical protein Molly2_32 [Maribacter phage Molly_2]QQO97914.1 hypothetical protein Molly3_32 [Maribacter phage Molly_3]QQO98114.1 hypothetical protein Molly4_32 [Maribacter phage Molly_4]QQO98314.1 hypothetical protein Molly5_32 [Maribacter phage Molly_5]QQO97313.1 hypothetical protein Colly1_31 [Maribacter phage Colly_1]
MNLKSLVESNKPISSIMERVYYRMPPQYKDKPENMYDIKPGGYLYFADDSDKDFKFEEYLIIQLFTDERTDYVIIYDEDEDRIKCVTSDNYYEHGIGYAESSEKNLALASQIWKDNASTINLLRRHPSAFAYERDSRPDNYESEIVLGVEDRVNDFVNKLKMAKAAGVL